MRGRKVPDLDIAAIAAAGADRAGPEGRDAGPPAPSMRMLAIMEAVARAGAPVTPTTINLKMGLPKPTIHRLFATLEEEGFLQREIDGRSYSPGARMNRMGVETVSAVRVRGARLIVMEKLAQRIGETINLAIPERNAMTYLDRVETQWPLRIQLPVGTRVPLHCTASGKMYLSSLDEARRERFIRNADLEPRTPNSIRSARRLREQVEEARARGYALDDEEFMEGMIALAVGIRDRQGHLFATVSFHAPTLRMNLAAAHEHLEALREGAAELERIVNAG